MKKVCCVKINGEPHWTLQHQDINCPRVITLDKNGIVYIVSPGTNCIVAVSPIDKNQSDNTIRG